MKSFKTMFLLLIFIGLSSCKDNPSEAQEKTATTEVSTYYFIKHAEIDRSDSQNADPELIQKGLGRAMHWAEIFKDVELDAIYSTDYSKASMTAAPTSVKKNIDVHYYNLEDIQLEQFKNDHANKNILIVGDRDSTPNFVNQILGEIKYPTMDDYDNGSLFIVQIVNGTATAQRLHMNCNCPD